MFSSYVEHPLNCSFEGQDTGEKILLLLRAHHITNLTWLIPAILLFIWPFFILRVFQLINIDISALPEIYGMAFLIINYLLALIIVYEGFLNWYFNVYIVTEKNIVDIDFHSLLFKNIDVAPLRNVEDASSSMGGIIQSVFHFGDVFIQTAGASKNIDFHSVPKPHQVVDFILDETHKIYGKGRHAEHPG